MAFDPTLPTPVDRIRDRIGDTDDPPLLVGGELRYQALYNGAGGDEDAATLTAARRLRRQLALLPTSRSAEGVSESYADRVSELDKLITELEAEIGSGSASAAPVGSSTVTTRTRW